MAIKTAPQPTTDTPLFPAGDYLADVDGYLYEPTGEALIIDRSHATIGSLNTETERRTHTAWD